MNRRTVLSGLAVGSLGAVAGCMSEGCTVGAAIIFEPVDTETIAADWTSEFGRTPAMMTALADRVLAGEEPTVETIRNGPLGWMAYVEHDETFYEITEETIAEGQVSGPEYELSQEHGMNAEELAADAIAFVDLPRHDQWRVTEAWDYGISADGIREFYSEASFVAGYIDEADQDGSMLAAGIDASAIEADGDVTRIEYLGEGSADAKRYRYTATHVADDADAFAVNVLDRHGSTAFDPSDEARRLLSETQEAGGSLQICEQGSTGVDEETNERRRAALDELEREVDSLTSPVAPDDEASPQVQYVQYEGQWYRIDIDHYAV